MNEPKLRFKADDGSQFPDWKENKIGELGIFTKGAPLSKADISDCGTPLILYGELYTTYNEVAYDIQRRTQSTVDEKYYSLVGDVVIPTSGETAEEISTATCVMAQNVILAGDLNIYRSDIVDGRIMSYILNHQAKWKIATLAQGKSIVHIQAAQLSDVAIKYPPSTVEQQKIAFLFTELDTLIQSAEKELEGYRELKEGMLQKMFPKKGETVPEIRFPEFTGDWELCILGEITKTNPFKPFIAEGASDGSYEVIQQGDTPISGYANGQPFQNYENITLFGDHTLSLYKPKSPFFVASDGVKILSPSIDMNGLFYYYLLMKYKPNSEGYKRHYTIMKGCEASYPSNRDEQIRIAEYFENLDNLIGSQQQELDGYKELKKGLLQQMFCQQKDSSR